MTEKTRLIQKEALLDILKESIGEIDQQFLQQIAFEIEEQTYIQTNRRIGDDYKKKLQLIKQKIRGPRGLSLRQSLVNGIITPQDLVKLQSEQTTIETSPNKPSEIKLPPQTNESVKRTLPNRYIVPQQLLIEPQQQNSSPFLPLESPSQFTKQLQDEFKRQEVPQIKEVDFDEEINQDYTQELRDAQNNTDFGNDESNLQLVQKMDEQSISPRFEPLPENDPNNQEFIQYSQEEESLQQPSKVIDIQREDTLGNVSQEEIEKVKFANRQLEIKVGHQEEQIILLKKQHQSQLERLQKEFQEEKLVLQQQIEFQKSLLVKNQGQQGIQASFQKRQQVLKQILAEIQKKIEESNNFGENLQLFKNLLGSIQSVKPTEQKESKPPQQIKKNEPSNQLQQITERDEQETVQSQSQRDYANNQLKPEINSISQQKSETNLDSLPQSNDLHRQSQPQIQQTPPPPPQASDQQKKKGRRIQDKHTVVPGSLFD
ncbi:hypothetical protein pb186bvf_007987 [Paramecium bursaria]